MSTKRGTGWKRVALVLLALILLHLSGIDLRHDTFAGEDASSRTAAATSDVPSGTPRDPDPGSLPE